MPISIRAHFLPDLTTPEALAASTVVVIDVLRATTTITYALAAGCREVVPCLTVDEARQFAATLAVGDAVLGGERDGLPIAGFDLGNSPADYTPAAVGGKSVVFTTTNGTKAMQICSKADRVMIGAFVNFTAICRALAGSAKIDLLCAGTGGSITREDVLLAGALTDALTRDAPQAMLNDEAALARAAWREIVAKPMPHPGAHELGVILAQQLRLTLGGRNLAAIGLARDIEEVAQIDRFDIAGRLDLANWRIVC